MGLLQHGETWLAHAHQPALVDEGSFFEYLVLLQKYNSVQIVLAQLIDGHMMRILCFKHAIQKIVRHPLLGWLGSNLDRMLIFDFQFAGETESSAIARTQYIIYNTLHEYQKFSYNQVLWSCRVSCNLKPSYDCYMRQWYSTLLYLVTCSCMTIVASKRRWNDYYNMHTEHKCIPCIHVQRIQN